MAQADSIHVRVVAADTAVDAYPELARYMKPEMRQRLREQAQKVKPLLVELRVTDDRDDDAISTAEVTLANTRQLVSRVHHGVRYCYRNYQDVLTAVSPLRLGGDPNEDEVRLVTLIRVLPTSTPPFAWLPHDGVTLDVLEQQLRAHREAITTLTHVGRKDLEARKQLRALRASSNALWDEGLDAWIVANVPKDLWLTFGRERRTRPRAAAPATPVAAPVPGDGPAPAIDPAATRAAG